MRGLYTKISTSGRGAGSSSIARLSILKEIQSLVPPDCQ